MNGTFPHKSFNSFHRNHRISIPLFYLGWSQVSFIFKINVRNRWIGYCLSTQWTVHKFNSCAISCAISTPAGLIGIRRYGANEFINENSSYCNKKWIIFYKVDQTGCFQFAFFDKSMNFLLLIFSDSFCYKHYFRKRKIIPLRYSET